MGVECDDGNPSNTDACLDTCKNAKCGDSFIQAGAEQCDDGNQINGDGCESNCTVCGRDAPGASSCCGNGLLDPGEQCDDSNTINGDGCNSLCQGEVNLRISKTDGPDPVVHGNTLTYLINVTNTGAGAATQVKMIDSTTPTDNFAFVSAKVTVGQGNCSYNPGTYQVTCDLSQINPGQTKTMLVKVRPRKPPSMTNSATVISAQPDSTPADNTVSGVQTTVQ